MPLFSDLYDWVDEHPDNYVHAAMGVVYDKANREESTEPSPDFAACANGLAVLIDGDLGADFLVTFSDRIVNSRGSWATGQRSIWNVRFLRDGQIEIFQRTWTRDWVRLTDVQRLDVGGADFAIGFLQNRSTRALLSFSFDKLAGGFPL
ncbi:hypothetical protein GCM10027020_23240 [Nocardioides salsibiostraticola]